VRPTSFHGAEFSAWEREFVPVSRSRPTGISIPLGEPGIGKTTFIRHLLARLKRTHRFCFVPSAEIQMLVSAGALSSWVGEIDGRHALLRAVAFNGRATAAVGLVRSSPRELPIGRARLPVLLLNEVRLRGFEHFRTG